MGRVKERERILCAAVWLNDHKKREHQPVNIEEGVVSCGHRHHNCFILLFEAVPDLKKSKYLMVQGFLTDKNKFVDRNVGFCVARRSKQIDSEEQMGVLFSEMLW